MSIGAAKVAVQLIEAGILPKTRDVRKMRL
jgi:hypothetical protein